MIKELILEADKMIWKECLKTWCSDCKYNKTVINQSKMPLCYVVNKLAEKYK